VPHNSVCGPCQWCFRTPCSCTATHHIRCCLIPSFASLPGSRCRLLVADSGSMVDCRVRISDITLEIVAEDVVSGEASDRVWESIDVMNPYAGTSLSSSRVQAAYDEAEAGYGLDYCEWGHRVSMPR
jgi:hypothetical protein